MRPYEVAIIFDATLEEESIRSILDRVGEIVKARAGTVGRVDRWGRRGFAYELDHRTEGYYVFVEVSAEPEAVSEVSRMLTLADEVLRHRIIRQPDHASGSAEHAPAAIRTPSTSVG